MTGIELPETEIFTETKRKVKEVSAEEKQVIVHCAFYCPPGEPQLIRIWNSTFLVDRHSDHRSRLLFWDNITLCPNWTAVLPGRAHNFTLIFSGLPGPCRIFDFAEVIPQSGGFFVPGIQRNETDVYHLTL